MTPILEPAWIPRIQSIRRAAWLAPGIVACVLFGLAVGSSADSTGEPNANAAKTEYVGMTVAVELSSGKIIDGCKVGAARSGKAAGTISVLTLIEAESGKRLTYGAAAIKQVKDTEGRVRLLYDEVAKTLVAPDAENIDEIRRAAQDEPRTRPPKRPKAEPKRKDTAKKSPEEQKAEEDARREEKEKQRREFFEKTGVRLWPELTDEQVKAACDAQKKFLAKVTEVSKLPMQLSETKHFLFLSDIPPQQTAMYVPYLDQMYAELCKAFALPKDANVWKGKGVVVAFLTKEAFAGFEAVFFKPAPAGANGLAHLQGDGNVIISCFRGDRPASFASVLVHETTHGFMFRYKSPLQLPIWLEEGAADWMAASVVTSDIGVPLKQKAAIQAMRMTGSLGGNFFDAKTAVLSNEFYGASSSITDFMLRTDPKRYRKLIDGIKTGTPWEQSLKSAYGWTKADLAARYGTAIGVPGLQP